MLPRRQALSRAHLLGSGVGPGADRRARCEGVAGGGGRYRQEADRRVAAVQHAHEEMGGERQQVDLEGEGSMDIKGTVALVTGANRGIGRSFVEVLLERGATTIYAGARDPAKLADLVERSKGKVVALKLDITQPADITAAVKACRDVRLLVNNAGINRQAGLIAATDLGAARAEMETNYFGPLSMCRAFAPILKANGGGAIVNMLSILARVNMPMYGSLSASKAAALSLTQGVRGELAKHVSLVVAIMPGAVDT